MTTIYSYSKVITQHTTIQALLPDNQGIDDALRCTELCTISGTTYLAVPAGVTLPAQPKEIVVKAVVLTDALKELIKTASPHVALISERVRDKIRAKYSLEDEFSFARIGVKALKGKKALSVQDAAEADAYDTDVEAIRQWGRDERAKLGL